jgi:RNA methyltransferase, TrmH family
MLVKSQVKYIQSLGQKKFRDSEAVFVAEGPKIINELLMASNTKPVHLFATKNWIDENGESMKALPAELLIEISDKELERISFLTTPNDVLGIFEKPVFNNVDVKNKITLILDGIQDPGNIGTIVRTADWFGVSQVVCSKESADVFNPKVVQSTMGSITRVQVIYEELKTFLSNHSNIPLYAATLDGKKINEVGKIEKGFIIIGNESKGISKELLALSTQQITIPKSGNAESLNAAVATGIILSYITNDRSSN